MSQRQVIARQIARNNGAAKALAGADECARLVIRTSILVMSASLNIQPHEIPDLVQNHREKTERRISKAMKKQTELLTSIFRGLILHADEDEHQVLAICVSSLK